MRAPASIAGRLMLGLLAGLALVWLAGSIASVLILRVQIEQTLDGGLRETAERILPLVLDTIGDADAGEADARTLGLKSDDDEGGEYVVYQVRAADGTVLLRSHDAPAIAFDAELVGGFTTQGSWRIYTGSAGGIFVQVAEDVSRRSAAVWQSAAAMALPFIALIPLAAVVIWFAVRRGLAPLRQLGQEVAARDAANLAPLPDIASPTELRPVRGALDALLTRVRTALEAERALAANSAHELRTPIAGSLAQTQRLVEELEGNPAQARAKLVEATLHRLAALASKLLALSRAEAGIARLATPVDLMPALNLIVADARRTLGERLTVSIAPGARLVAPLDLDAFGIVMRNLIENADRHGLPGGPVAIDIDNGTVCVSNEGNVIPADRLETLTRRFERGATQAEGSGLGLTIVETIVRQIGGNLELHSPLPGKTSGFAARVTF